jgi:hypothetical protein
VVKCPQCGYQNKDDAHACNLCHAVLRKQRKTVEMPVVAGPKHVLESVGSAPVELVPGTEFSIGRQPGCSLVIPSGRVSRVHAVIRWEEGKPILSDKNSSNGTFVRGKRIKEHPLQDGDELEIGPFLCVYRFGDEKKPAQADLGEHTQTLSAQSDVFTGSLGPIGIAEILQGLEFNKKTGTLDVFGKEGDGWISIDNGRPLAALANGEKEEEAVFSLLAMKSGRFTFTPEIEVREKRINATITAILLEWGRRSDESEMLKKTKMYQQPDDETDISV